MSLLRATSYDVQASMKKGCMLSCTDILYIYACVQIDMHSSHQTEKRAVAWLRRQELWHTRET